MNQERFMFFSATHHESDLLIGVPHSEFSREMEEVTFMELIRLRKVLLDYTQNNPQFFTSLEPLPIPGTTVPEEISTMIICSQKTGTGPMSAVAGLFANFVGQKLVDTFQLTEVVVENGGDLYLKNETDLVSVIHAGDSPLSDKMAFVVPGGEWGICTSSGTLGHSFSRGKADSVTVISESAPLADAWATTLANQVNGPDDIEPLLDRVVDIPDILGCAVIVADRVGIRGEFEVKLLT